jgi:hypothetical protein
MVPVTPATAMAFPATAEQAMVRPAMADQATADAATADPETAAADFSVEQAFFERATASSDRPVSFDSELPEPSFDLEARELRRAHFTRVVGAIISALGIGALLALAQPGPPADETAPVVAAYVAPQEMPEMQLIEPAPGSAAPAASVSVAPAASVSVAPAASVSVAPAASVSVAASSAASRPRKRVPEAVVTTPPPLTDVPSAPPAARFDD